MQNFATQSLLMAVGVGAQKALAASAAINWMLKDGMNRLVRMGVATQFGNAFDSDLKVRQERPAPVEARDGTKGALPRSVFSRVLQADAGLCIWAAASVPLCKAWLPAAASSAPVVFLLLHLPV
jgi:hypothetical protein